MGYLNNEIDTLSLFFHGHFSWFFVKMSRTMSQKVVHWYLKRQLTIFKKIINSPRAASSNYFIYEKRQLFLLTTQLHLMTGFLKLKFTQSSYSDY
jgi:hypothetical protein